MVPCTKLSLLVLIVSEKCCLIYPESRASLTKPFLDLRTRVCFFGCASSASSAPPTTITTAFPPSGLFIKKLMLSLLQSTIPNIQACQWKQKQQLTTAFVPRSSRYSRRRGT
ncbi:hypothetical protein T06_9773 [Trichinella sp. T6]|nr:hypothetical protein T06_9773 [Trichinella sp. T6]